MTRLGKSPAPTSKGITSVLAERHLSKKPMIIAVSQHKGGTGKTSTCLNLGAALAEQGYQVLLVDLDPQADLSAGLGVDVDAQRTIPNLYTVLANDQGTIA